MAYQVPQHIAPQKVFLVNFTELEGRLDPAFYNPQYYKFINSKTVNWVRLNAVIENIKHPPEYKRDFVDEGYQLIRSQNVRPTGIDLSENPVYLAKDVVLSTSAIYPHINDILIVRSGVNAGDVAVVEDEFKNVTIGADTLLLNVNQEILPKFVQVYFFTEIGRSLLNRYITGATNKHLNSYSLKHVYFPKIEISTQERCITIIESALLQKSNKLEQAKRLLNSINKSFLSELGIILQQKSIQSLQDRIFTLNFSEISGGRFDPKLYSSSIAQLKQSLFMSPYDKQPLKDFIISSCSGEWGKDELEEVDENKFSKCLVIRATEFDNTFNLQLDNSRVKYRWIENSKLSKMNIQANDLLIEKSGGSEDQPVGRVSILTDNILKDNTIAYSNFIHKITVEGINPMYLYFYLKTMHNIKITDSMQSQTNGIRNLIMQEYLNQTIVVPPLQKQQEIVDHITATRKQAKALQEEGKEIIEQAKKEVERMIIGDQ